MRKSSLTLTDSFCLLCMMDNDAGRTQGYRLRSLAVCLSLRPFALAFAIPERTLSRMMRNSNSANTGSGKSSVRRKEGAA